MPLVLATVNDTCKCTMPACNLWHHVVNGSTQSRPNPPTVWPLNIIHCDFEWSRNYASPQYDIKYWMHLHSTQSTLLLFDHSMSSTVVWNDTMPACNLWHHVVNVTTHSRLNPPTVWPLNIIHCGFECSRNYASLQYETKWWMHLHSTQSTLLLFDHSMSSTVVWNDTMPVCNLWYHVVNVSNNPPTVWPFNIIHCGFEW